MSEFMFGGSTRKLSRADARKIERIAKRHGAYLVEYRDPTGEYQWWLAAPNRGFPDDDALARAVFADMEAAGLQAD